MKKFNLLLVAGLLMLGLTACGPALVDKYEEIKPNETAFVIPLEGKTSKQGKFDSEEYLEKNKVAAKRIYLPLKKIDTGRFYYDYKWVPTVMVIRVDRAPVTFSWADDKGIKVESRDSIGFMVGIDISAHVAEKDTAKFLYNFPKGNCTVVLSKNVKSKATEILSREFAKYDLEGEKDKDGAIITAGARQQKGVIVELAKAELIDYFDQVGVTISTFGLVGGLAYEDSEIQTAINDNFKSELEIKNKENEGLAQGKVNAMKIGIATADKLAANEFAQAAESRKKMVMLEVELIKANAELEKAKKWNGQLPTNIIPEGSNFILGMNK